MEYPTFLKSSLLILAVLFSACSNELSIENSIISETHLRFHKGSVETLYASVEDSLYEHPFEIQSLNRVLTDTTDLLQVEVTYAGCEDTKIKFEHYFFLQWDGSVSKVNWLHKNPDTDAAQLGLAHFYPFELICSALIKETLTFDLDKLFEGGVNNQSEIELIVENLYNEEKKLVE